MAVGPAEASEHDVMRSLGCSEKLLQLHTGGSLVLLL